MTVRNKRSKPPVVAEGDASLIEIRPSPIAGMGVFATRRIPRGTRIIEYTGELITDEEASRRYDDDAMEQHHTFLFAVDDEMVIDGGVDGNEARYFNHACDPNCEAVNDGGRIFIEAIADIEPGAELLYDYALMRDEPWQDHWRELYACRCGTPSCRGTILKSPRPPKSKKRPKGRRSDRPRAAGAA
jgi:hypothetical protein